MSAISDQFDVQVGNISTQVQFHDGDLRNVVAQIQRSAGQALLVYDAAVSDLFESRESYNALELPSGEPTKQWSSVAMILDMALGRGLERADTIIGIGGGVVCDVTAFAAALYRRGVALELVPTTLLCMVDASLGGKCGINWGGYKNMVGLFYPARAVHIALPALDTLPASEYYSGLAEVIKSALLGDVELFGILRLRRDEVLKRDPVVVRELVRRCLQVKGAIVEQDFRESGPRAYLNLGHTFAHALEATAGFGVWSHGEAVAWGIAQALRLGVQLGITDSSYMETVVDTLRQYDFRIDLADLDVDRIIGAMYQDKKVAGAQLHLVLQRKLGETVVQAVAEKEVRQLWQ